MKMLDWTPLKKGGYNYRTRKLKVYPDRKIVFKPAIANYIFPLVFCIMPMFFLFIITNSTGNPSFLFLIPIFLILLIFFSTGLFLGYTLLQPIGFNLKKQVFYKGKKVIPLGDIDGIQVINEEVTLNNDTTVNSSKFISYEINLVLKDRSRINIVDHNRKDIIIQDAKTLSKHLNLPIYTLK